MKAGEEIQLALDKEDIQKLSGELKIVRNIKMVVLIAGPILLSFLFIWLALSAITIIGIIIFIVLSGILLFVQHYLSRDIKNGFKFRMRGEIRDRKIEKSGAVVDFHFDASGGKIKYLIQSPSGKTEILEDLSTPLFQQEKNLFFYIIVHEKKIQVPRSAFFQLIHIPEVEIDYSSSGQYLKHREIN